MAYAYCFSNSRQLEFSSKIQARFIRRILVASNAIETMDNEMTNFIIYCWNYIRCHQNSTYETGLTQDDEQNKF